MHLQHATDHEEQFIGEVGGDPFNLTRFNFRGQLNLVGCFERCPKTQHFIENTASGPDIALLVVRLL